MSCGSFTEYPRPPLSPGMTSFFEQCMGDSDFINGADSLGIFSGANCFMEDSDSRRPASPASPPLEEAPLSRQLGNSCGFLHATSNLQPCCTQPRPQLCGTGAESQPSTSAAAPSGPRKRGRKPHPRLPDLQLKLDQLLDLHRSLSRENELLRNKLKVLERVAPYRDESVGQLAQLLSSSQAHASARERTLNRGSAAAHEQHAHGSPDHLPSTSGDSQSFPAGVPSTTHLVGGTPANCDARLGGNGGCEATSGLPVDPAPWPRRSSAGTPSPVPPEGGRAASTPAALALCPGPDGEVATLTPAAVEELRRTTPDEFRALWQHICLQMGVLVSGAEVHGPGSPPHVRLERYLQRALSYVDKVKVLAPACFVQSMYTNLDTGEHERPNDNFWVTCARSLRLTPAQLAEVSSLADVYSETVAPVARQRVELASQLSTTLAAARSPPTCTNDAVAALHAVDELAQRLERNVMKEHQAHWDMNDYLCASVLTPLQVAKALTAAYPYIPDGVAMLHAFKQVSAAAAASPLGQLAPAAQPTPSNALLASLTGLLATQLTGVATPVAPARTCPPAAAAATAALAAILAGLQAAQRPVAAAAPQPAYLHSVLAGLQAAHALGRAAA